MDKPNHIHDTFVKQLLSHKDVAVAFLQAYLPENVSEVLDFTTLEYENTSYLSKELESSFSDMVWRISSAGNQTFKVSVLLEHKSYPDSKVAFQMLEYVAMGYKKQLESKKKLELIIPILYYHGQKKFSFKTLLQHFDNLPLSLRSYIPTYQTEFINLHDLDVEQIKNLRNGLLQSAFLFQKNYHDPERLNNSIINILESLEPYSDLNSISFIIVYMLSNENLKKEELKKALNVLPTTISKNVMSIYDELILEGKIEGIKEGEIKGIKEGEIKGKKEAFEEMTLKAFDNGVELQLIKVITGESIEAIQEILKRNQRL